MEVPATPADIWNHIKISNLSARVGLDGQRFIVGTGECEWDHEHGILLSWREGRDLCFVGANEGEFGGDNPEADREDGSASVILLGGPATIALPLTGV